MLKISRFVSLIVALLAALGIAFAANPAFAQGTTTAQEDEQDDEQRGSQGRFAGAVFAMTNETAGNRIVVYGRASDGTLTRLRSVRTRGLGQGVDTDTQGPLRLSADNRFLYAVNPGSDNISVFEVDGTRLRFRQIIDAATSR